MKKKQIRTIAILAIVVLFAGISLARLRIEPHAPSQSDDAPATETTPSDETTTDTPDTPGPEEPETETPLPAETVQEPEAEQPAEEVPDEEPQAEAPPTYPEPEVSVPPEMETRHLCTLEIRCDTVVDTTKLENQAVAPYVPASGVILSATEVEYTPGESVFDVLLRGTREHDIQMEFREDGLYSGAYIEGINYLYEFDGGSLSGWMYKVDGQFPNYGCGAYTVEDGDAIVWMYTCDLGRDVGDNSTW